MTLLMSMCGYSGLHLVRRRGDHLLARRERGGPVLEPLDAVVMVPERRKYMLVVEKGPDLVRESLPYGIVDAPRAVQTDKGVKECPECRTLSACFGTADILRIGGVECHPKQNEADMVVVAGLLGTTEPADRAVNSKTQGFGKAGPDRSLPLLQCLEPEITPVVHA